MRLSKQMFSSALVRPAAFETTSTLDLIGNGAVFHSPYRGVPVFTPLGARVLRGIEAVLTSEAEGAGFDFGALPSVVADEDLHRGAEVGEVFAEKLVRLGKPFEGFHLLSTPEMLMYRFSRADVLSHRALPVRLSYATDFFRNVPATRTLLTCRQFRMFGMLSIERDGEALSESLADARAAMQAAFHRLGVQTTTRPMPNERLGFATSYRHQSWDGGGAREKMLAMGYHYASQMRLPLKYRSAANANTPASIFTYGASVYRLTHAVFEAARDRQGFNLGNALRPFDTTVIPRTEADAQDAARIYAAGMRMGFRPALDDRFGLSAARRRAFSEYFGAPTSVEVHAGQAVVQIRGVERPVLLSAHEPGRVIENMSAPTSGGRGPLAACRGTAGRWSRPEVDARHR